VWTTCPETLCEVEWPGAERATSKVGRPNPSLHRVVRYRRRWFSLKAKAGPYASSPTDGRWCRSNDASALLAAAAADVVDRFIVPHRHPVRRPRMNAVYNPPLPAAAVGRRPGVSRTPPSRGLAVTDCATGW